MRDLSDTAEVGWLVGWSPCIGQQVPQSRARALNHAHSPPSSIEKFPLLMSNHPGPPVSFLAAVAVTTCPVVVPRFEGVGVATGCGVSHWRGSSVSPSRPSLPLRSPLFSSVRLTGQEVPAGKDRGLQFARFTARISWKYYLRKRDGSPRKFFLFPAFK